MVTSMRVVLLAAVAFPVVGCGVSLSGAYAPYSTWRGNGTGYQETQLAENQWLVSYRGNGMTDPAKAVDFTLLRAAELALASGARYFVIASSANTSQVSSLVVPGSGTAQTMGTGVCTGTATTATCTGLGTTSYSYVPPQAYQIVKPGVAIHMVAYESAPAEVGVFDAQLLARSLRAKYRLK